jgi:succinyl-diaminopimelate desuccinylase
MSIIILLLVTMMMTTTISGFKQEIPAVRTQISRVAELARDLIRIESITPSDGPTDRGCQDIVRNRLEKIGFVCETMKFNDVVNLWAHRGEVGRNSNKRLVVFAGHTDVVPPGPLEEWKYPPFDGVIEEDILHGRGAVDMKGGIASMVVALENFIAEHPDHTQSIGVILTSDEEGKAEFGTKLVVHELTQRGITIDMGIVGEPSSSDKIGDAIKIGRRGSLGGELTIKGIQGHVAYPDKSLNPIHESLGALKELVDMKWDNGTEDFNPTTFQISNINSGTGARNVIPGFKTVEFNFRHSPASTAESLRVRVEKVLENHSLNYEMKWHEASIPYETDANSMIVTQALESVLQVTGLKGKLCTSGGTSDGRFLSAAGAKVIELGPSNKTIHKVNEHVAISDLQTLTAVYENLLSRLLLSDH